MPKSTFFNLSDDKKERIFDAAVQEFSKRRFSDASINQIIKNAGIPKGSFYQYFADKEDIYLYMVEKISKESHEILGDREALNPDAGFLETIIQRAKDTLKLGKQRPDYTKIGVLMVVDNSAFTFQLLKASSQKHIEMIERDKQRGLIKPEIDSGVLIKLIHIYVYNEYLYSGFDENLYLKKVESAVQIIKQGIVVHQD
ncbi:TetR/AcrR family transcriptional regulator [Phosphitispora fastidiosa]|uniref:TetR/AcrR family transcriptional regulator n=1 Tax=Phosphitispora fastidiosa TaxID=2837202 RepID=UPI001E4D4A3F|nr:TetR/AcrR family transcriptional regulator [Phosphitispora fastidiosa]MBU7006578.1 AcrR family transcriptional regulator [Phosphitispora fastidiosa]